MDPKYQSAEHRLTVQELQMSELRMWLEKKFDEIKEDRTEEMDLVREVREKVIRLETLQEVRDGALERKPTTNPLNRPIGSLLGDVIVTALKTTAVAAASALIILGYQRANEKIQDPQHQKANP